MLQSVLFYLSYDHLNIVKVQLSCDIKCSAVVLSYFNCIFRDLERLRT